MAASDDGFFSEADLVYAYTVDQAVEDGVLVDVTETAKEAGFSCRGVVTRAVWDDCVEWSEKDAKRSRALQDEAGRLWDVVWMAGWAARIAARAERPKSEALFKLVRVPRPGRGRVRNVVLKVAMGSAGPDAGSGPVATIMMREED